MRTNRPHFLVILGVVVLIAALTSHALIRWFGIQIDPIDYRVFGAAETKPYQFVAGSSLMRDGLDWNQISKEAGAGIENWGVPGSSPVEWESFQLNAPTQASQTFIVVSVYDLNEQILCDFRADLVPPWTAAYDLWRSGVDSAFAKRCLSQYPMRYLRFLFPTLGRSDGVMVGFRKKASQWLRPFFTLSTESGPTLKSGTGGAVEEYKKEAITDWDSGRMLRRLAGMRSACQSRQEFNGPKRAAFIRMLRRGAAQGSVTAIVVPVSPTYRNELLNDEAKRRFEEAIRSVQEAVTQAKWIRLDQTPELNSDTRFWDLVHMNLSGQELATREFMKRWKEVTPKP